ncbi:unnamed protein product [Moneuplotes crassus]|uniref:Uncharacterized protein n=1 Tax=Euplotes crassus TaxID=5936 RepID=A0AAD1XCB3_EUPCR|nr:unnamed protein product [Moneuplotes crassus]
MAGNLFIHAFRDISLKTLNSRLLRDLDASVLQDADEAYRAGNKNNASGIFKSNSNNIHKMMKEMESNSSFHKSSNKNGFKKTVNFANLPRESRVFFSDMMLKINDLKKNSRRATRIMESIKNMGKYDPEKPRIKRYKLRRQNTMSSDSLERAIGKATGRKRCRIRNRADILRAASFTNKFTKRLTFGERDEYDLGEIPIIQISGSNNTPENFENSANKLKFRINSMRTGSKGFPSSKDPSNFGIKKYDDNSLTDSILDNSNRSRSSKIAPFLNDIKEINETYSENFTSENLSPIEKSQNTNLRNSSASRLLSLSHGSKHSKAKRLNFISPEREVSKLKIKKIDGKKLIQDHITILAHQITLYEDQFDEAKDHITCDKLLAELFRCYNKRMHLFIKYKLKELELLNKAPKSQKSKKGGLLELLNLTKSLDRDRNQDWEIKLKKLKSVVKDDTNSLFLNELKNIETYPRHSSLTKIISPGRIDKRDRLKAQHDKKLLRAQILQKSREISNPKSRETLFDVIISKSKLRNQRLHAQSKSPSLEKITPVFTKNRYFSRCNSPQILPDFSLLNKTKGCVVPVKMKKLEPSKLLKISTPLLKNYLWSKKGDSKPQDFSYCSGEEEVKKRQGNSPECDNRKIEMGNRRFDDIRRDTKRFPKITKFSAPVLSKRPYHHRRAFSPHLELKVFENNKKGKDYKERYFICEKAK